MSSTEALEPFACSGNFCLALVLEVSSNVKERVSSSVNLGVSMSTSIPGQKHPEFKNHLPCGRQFPSTFITSDEKTGGGCDGIILHSPGMEATQMQNQSRAEGETRVEWVQDSARALWDAGTNICNKPPLFLYLHTLNSKMPKMVIAARTSV